MTWSSDATGDSTYVCPGWERFTGQTIPAACGAGWSDAVHSEDRLIVQGVFREACRQGQAFWIIYRLRHRTGTWHWVMASAKPSHSPTTHAFIGFLGSVVLIEVPDAAHAHGEVEAARECQPVEREPKSRLDMLADLATLSRMLAQEEGDSELAEIFGQCLERIENRIAAEADQHKLM